MMRRSLLRVALILCFALTAAAFRASAQSDSTAQKQDDTPTAGSKGYTLPKCSYCPTPEYSKEGLKKKIQGVVVLKTVVGPDGRVRDVTVTRSLGYGLDEQAVNTVRDKWEFTPANGPDGKPAAVRLMIEVNFHLY
jgi:TonB family protein